MHGSCIFKHLLIGFAFLIVFDARGAETSYFYDEHTGCEDVRLSNTPSPELAAAATESKWCALYALVILFDGNTLLLSHHDPKFGPGYGMVAGDLALQPGQVQMGSWHAVCNGWTCSSFKLDAWGDIERHDSTLSDLLF